MKKIEAIIDPSRLNEVKAALAKVCVEGMSISQVMGRDLQNAETDLYRGVEFVIEFATQVKIEIILENFKATQVVEVIKKAARINATSAAKIFVFPVDDVMRVRTGEHGSGAM